GGLFSTNLQLPVHHDPLGGQFKILIICKAQFALDSETTQRRRTDVEDHVLAFFNADLVACDWHFAARPGGRIRPARLFDRRRSSILSLNDSGRAAEQECRNERKKKQTILFSQWHRLLYSNNDPVYDA